MQKILALVFATLGWFAVVAQFWLMMGASAESQGEIIIRFFSYFTILTNTLVSFFFTLAFFSPERFKAGTLTAITVYITVVGLVYQVVLRSIWDPQGLQRVVDELLHSVIPVCTIIYWFMYEQKLSVKFIEIPRWLIYPLVYFVFVLFRGSLSGFYPYPFVDVNSLGYGKVAVNAIVILVIFVLLAMIFIAIGKRTATRKPVT